ncbi:MAG TPA: hypothetical protein PLV81_15435, partial [Spirochaetota bacterium]|nr:hypothetical protein [Spirochaetota bacterium]
MKKYFILFMIVVFLNSMLYAADLGVGISAWYADWKMERKSSTVGGTVNMDEVLYIGPSIAY